MINAVFVAVMVLAPASPDPITEGCDEVEPDEPCLLKVAHVCASEEVPAGRLEVKTRRAYAGDPPYGACEHMLIYFTPTGGRRRLVGEESGHGFGGVVMGQRRALIWQHQSYWILDYKRPRLRRGASTHPQDGAGQLEGLRFEGQAETFVRGKLGFPFRVDLSTFDRPRLTDPCAPKGWMTAAGCIPADAAAGYISRSKTRLPQRTERCAPGRDVNAGRRLEVFGEATCARLQLVVSGAAERTDPIFINVAVDRLAGSALRGARLLLKGQVGFRVVDLKTKVVSPWVTIDELDEVRTREGGAVLYDGPVVTAAFDERGVVVLTWVPGYEQPVRRVLYDMSELRSPRRLEGP